MFAFSDKKIKIFASAISYSKIKTLKNGLKQWLVCNTAVCHPNYIYISNQTFFLGVVTNIVLLATMVKF